MKLNRECYISKTPRRIIVLKHLRAIRKTKKNKNIQYTSECSFEYEIKNI